MNNQGSSAARWYTITGILAIVAGGVVSAFLAKHPSTLAMWTSAYLVLVVGVTQLFFGKVFAKLGHNDARRIAYVVFALFNAGNALVIASTVAKYAGLDWNTPPAVIGSLLLIAALALLSWHIQDTKPSWIKTAVYLVVVVLAVSIPIGLFLSQQ